MLHEGRTGMVTNITGGARFFEHQRHIQHEMNKFICSVTDISMEFLEENKDVDVYLNRDEALKMLSDKFVEANVVEDTFLQGILKREAVFPTGLQLDVYGVAIPHTDPEYVKETQIGFMSLNNPVVFRDMGDLDY